jgi:uncharacterized protein (DUF885 family)
VRRTLALGAALLVAAAPLLAQRPATGAPGALHALLAEDWEWRMREWPQWATAVGDHRYGHRLDDRSAAGVARRQAHAREMLRRARALRRDGLGEQDRLSLDLFLWEQQLAVDGERFPDWRRAVTQLDGVHIDFVATIEQMPYRTARDYDAYLARLEGYPAQLDQVIAVLREGLASGWVEPSVPLRGVPAQVAPQLVTRADSSPLFAPVRELPTHLPEGERTRIRARATALIEGGVVPALRRLHDFLRDEYLPAVPPHLAATALPDGAAYYGYRIRQQTSLALGAREVHDLGLREVARIRAQMDSVMRSTGYQGSFAEFLTFLRTDPRFYHTSADELVEGYRDLAKRADAGLPGLFATLPRTPYGVRAFNDYEAPSQTTGQYRPGAADGSRPGWYMVNTYRLEARPIYEMEALTLHEAMPGHHLQIARAQELDGLPAFRRNGGYTAYVEGWALYAERLGEAMGFYRDPYAKFGQLTYEMWRACRLVVDTGMHALGWSRQQAIDYMLANTAKSEQDVTVEVDRYIVWPGQALAYKLGEITIRELRVEAERALGERFDVRRFHNAVLDDGPLPLEVLRTRMRAWIAREGALTR